MSRIRWYHFYFLLALFDVVVILFSLHLHSRTLGSVGGLIVAATHLDEQSRWIQLAQQRILQLNAPGNDLFRAGGGEDYTLLRRRFDLARENMNTTLERAEDLDLDVRTLKAELDHMLAAADRIFQQFHAMSQGPLEAARRQKILLRAGPTMAEMDDRQHQALRALGGLFARNASGRNRLLQSHEANLQQRIIHERYFIAAVVLILIGVLAFGRRLQQADRALEAERRRVREERRERLAAIGELCSGVAHGIRNPLAAIRSSAELTLELGRMDDNSRRRLGDILDEGRILGDRVTGLLDMARVDNEAFEVVDLARIVSTAVRELRPAMAKRGVRVELASAEGPLHVSGDRRRLEQAIIELLSNAMEHSPQDGVIHLACRGPAGDGLASVVIEDHGPGIPKEVQSRVFDLFFTTKPSGTGIGLAAVKRTAKHHEGNVAVESSASGGARFVLSLPVAKRHDTAKRSS